MDSIIMDLSMGAATFGGISCGMNESASEGASFGDVLGSVMADGAAPEAELPPTDEPAAEVITAFTSLTQVISPETDDKAFSKEGAKAFLETLNKFLSEGSISPDTVKAIWANVPDEEKQAYAELIGAMCSLSAEHEGEVVFTDENNDPLTVNRLIAELIEAGEKLQIQLEEQKKPIIPDDSTAALMVQSIIAGNLTAVQNTVNVNAETGQNNLHSVQSSESIQNVNISGALQSAGYENNIQNGAVNQNITGSNSNTELEPTVGENVQPVENNAVIQNVNSTQDISGTTQLHNIQNVEIGENIHNVNIAGNVNGAVNQSVIQNVNPNGNIQNVETSENVIQGIVTPDVYANEIRENIQSVYTNGIIQNVDTPDGIQNAFSEGSVQNVIPEGNIQNVNNHSELVPDNVSIAITLDDVPEEELYKFCKSLESELHAEISVKKAPDNALQSDLTAKDMGSRQVFMSRVRNAFEETAVPSAVQVVIPESTDFDYDTAVSPSDTAELADRITERITLMEDISSDKSEISMKLSPDDMGDICVRIKKDSDGMHISFAAQKDEAAQIIGDRAAALAEALSSRGIKLKELSVTQQITSGQADNNALDYRESGQHGFADAQNGGRQGRRFVFNDGIMTETKLSDDESAEIYYNREARLWVSA